MGNGFCTSHGREKTITQNPSESQPVSSNKPSLRQVGLAMKFFSFYWIFFKTNFLLHFWVFFLNNTKCAPLIVGNSMPWTPNESRFSSWHIKMKCSHVPHAITFYSCITSTCWISFDAIPNNLQFKKKF